MFDPNKLNSPNPHEDPNGIARQNVIKATELIKQLPNNHDDLQSRIAAAGEAEEAVNPGFNIGYVRKRLVETYLAEQGVVPPRKHWKFKEINDYNLASYGLIAYIQEWFNKKKQREAVPNNVSEMIDTPRPVVKRSREKVIKPAVQSRQTWKNGRPGSQAADPDWHKDQRDE